MPKGHESYERFGYFMKIIAKIKIIANIFFIIQLILSIKRSLICEHKKAKIVHLIYKCVTKIIFNYFK